MGSEITSITATACILSHRNYSHHVYVQESCIQLILGTLSNTTTEEAAVNDKLSI